MKWNLESIVLIRIKELLKMNESFGNNPSLMPSEWTHWSNLKHATLFFDMTWHDRLLTAKAEGGFYGQSFMLAFSKQYLSASLIIPP